MFSLIANAFIFSAFLLIASGLENSPPAALLRGRPDCTSMLSRCLIVAFAAFPGTAFTRLRAAERMLHRAALKLLSYACMLFSGRPYISEILLSAFVSLAVLGAIAARRLTHRVFSRAAKVAQSNVVTRSSNEAC